MLGDRLTMNKSSKDFSSELIGMMSTPDYGAVRGEFTSRLISLPLIEIRYI
jgi:hypothetical protein